MHLHVIAFDIPYPPTYGGVIDIYFKVRALSELGVKVILHCFEYGRMHASILDTICEKVYYYPRKKRISALPIRLPHIVNSRRSQALLDRLLEDSHPILFEGLHTCYYLSHDYLNYRQKIVRMHNIEWEYYAQLAQHEDSWPKRQYYHLESQLLHEYEKILLHADYILTISPADTEYYLAGHGGTKYLPAFHPHESPSNKLGKGEYCLYHGKLSVAENHYAAMFLIEEVFQYLAHPLIIAGSNPQPELIEAASAYNHINLRHNVGEGAMMDLMRNAHIHVLPTFQNTGIKLKLLNALFTGRFCLVNPYMVEKTGVEEHCVIASNAGEFRSLIPTLFRFEFSQTEIDRRKALLETTFSNLKNAETIKTLIASENG